MKPISGGKQLGWLNVTAPDGTRLSLQFLDSPNRAKSELAAVQKADSKFQGTTIGSVLVFVAPNGHAPPPSSDLTTLDNTMR